MGSEVFPYAGQGSLKPLNRRFLEGRKHHEYLETQGLNVMSRQKKADPTEGIESLDPLGIDKSKRILAWLLSILRGHGTVVTQVLAKEPVGRRTSINQLRL